MYLLQLFWWTSGVLFSWTAVYSQPFLLRKSLRFGPDLPHANFITSPDHFTSGSANYTNPDPFSIARSFLDALVKDLGTSHISYVIRNDSYTDRRTGISHIYVKQMVNGLAVSNGLININIEGGRVISYGDSFFRGDVLAETLDTPSMHRRYCNMIIDGLKDHQLSGYSSIDGQVAVAQLQELFAANCHFLTRNKIPTASYDSRDPRPAVLMFMIAATPSLSHADKLNSDFDQCISDISAISLSSDERRFELRHVPGAIDIVPVHLAYTQVPDGENIHLKLVWKFEVQMEHNWYEVTTDVNNPSNIISVVDWVSDGWSFSTFPASDMQRSDMVATYLVYDWGIIDPTKGQRSIQKESMDPEASPFGWHKSPVFNLPSGLASGSGFPVPQYPNLFQSTTTIGNNIYAQQNWNGGTAWVKNSRPNPGLSLNFAYDYDPSLKGPNPLQVARNFLNASITQLFYTLNDYHDFLYLYGFDEVSGNFQQYNFGRGGREGDAVIAKGQDGGSYNNAYFSTPPDGHHGLCLMYLWEFIDPYRDGDFDAGIVIHEYTHGLSMRLTGGPADSTCLSRGEAGGMGEGWSDWFAITIGSKPGITEYSMSSWVRNNTNGIRRYPYSLNTSVNPLTYQSLDGIPLSDVHAIGEVWAEILWIVNHKLILKHGYAEDSFPPKLNPNGTLPPNGFYRPVNDNPGRRPRLVPKHGNTLMIQLVINGMKLQPCRPTFIQARNAIIQADKLLTKGENFCALWEGFAERGLGARAREAYWRRQEDFNVPQECQT